MDNGLMVATWGFLGSMVTIFCIVLYRAVSVEIELYRDREYRRTHLSSVWMKYKLPEYLAK